MISEFSMISGESQDEAVNRTFKIAIDSYYSSKNKISPNSEQWRDGIGMKTKAYVTIDSRSPWIREPIERIDLVANRIWEDFQLLFIISGDDHPVFMVGISRPA